MIAPWRSQAGSAADSYPAPRGFDSRRHNFGRSQLILDDVAAASRTVNAFALVRIQVEEFWMVGLICPISMAEHSLNKREVPGSSPGGRIGLWMWGCSAAVSTSLCRREDRGFESRQPRSECRRESVKTDWKANAPGAQPANTGLRATARGRDLRLPRVTLSMRRVNPGGRGLAWKAKWRRKALGSDSSALRSEVRTTGENIRCRSSADRASAFAGRRDDSLRQLF